MFIQVKNLTRQVETGEGSLTLLDNISFDIEAGTSVAILGASGSGKTTLLGLLAGLDVSSSGEIRIGDQNLTAMDEDSRAELRARMVGFVFQNFQLLNGMTALENVMLPLELSDQENPRQAAEQLMQRVGLSHRLQHYPNQLSGGEQQRCAIARAFASEPAILFADEPTGNLDQKTGEKIIQLLFDLNQEKNTTLIMATHDTKLSEQCHRRLLLEAGKLVPSA